MTHGDRAPPARCFASSCKLRERRGAGRGHAEGLLGDRRQPQILNLDSIRPAACQLRACESNATNSRRNADAMPTHSRRIPDDSRFG